MAVSKIGTNALSSGLDVSSTNISYTGTLTGGTGVVNIGSGQVYKDASGNVGIGTSSPSDRLTVISAGTQVGSTNFRRISRIGLATTDASVLIGYDISAGSGILAPTNDFPLAFWTSSSGTYAERARIDSSGNMLWNGTSAATSNGNVGYIYKFFGAANNIVIPLESTGSGRYGIFEYRRTGRSSPRAAQVSIGENNSSQGEVQCYSSTANADVTGGVILANGATSWSAISDMRLKTVTGTYTNALQDIAKIQAIKFTWKHDPNATPQVGVSAQSVELVVPEAIATSRNIATPDDETDYLSVRYTELIPLMIASIQELKAELDSVKAELAVLKGV